jgi:hypothetical protein
MRRVAVCAALLFTSAFSQAATQATNTNTVAPTLRITATITDAVQLTLTQGSAGTSCVVNTGAGTDYAMDFGTVDALAINNPTCGSRYTPTQTGSDAVYYSDYKLNPSFTSQPNTTGPTIAAYVSTNFSHANVKIVRDTNNSSATPAANGFTTMSTNSGSPDTLASAVASGTPLTRWIGIDIAPTNGAALTGAQTATITFTLTVQ